MFGLFGSKKKEVKKEPVPTVSLQDTCNRLGDNIETTKLKHSAVEKELRTALETMRTARTPLQKQQAKQKATNLLKKKKMYESHMNTLSSTHFTVENANFQTQMMKDNIDVMNTLKSVNVQKDLMKGMNVDNLYDVMDDMKEMQEEQEEINDAFQRNYEVDVGDEELDAELDELDYQMRVELDSKELTAPNQRIMSQKEKDEKELENMLK